MLQSMGRLEDSLQCYERSLATKEAALGPDHVSVADTLFNIGVVRKKLGDAEGALVAFQRSAAVSTRALGPDHPNTRSAVEQLRVLAA